MEGLIFGGAYVRREICVSKSIGLACSGKEIYHFCFVLLCIREQIPCTSPLVGLYLERWFNGGFFASRFWGAYLWRGLYMEGLIFGILQYVNLWHAENGENRSADTLIYSIVLCEYCINNCFSVITCLEALICIKYGLDMFKKTEIVSIILWLLVQVFTFD